MTAVDERRATGRRQWGPAAAIAAAVLFVVTFLLVGDTGNTARETAQKLPGHEKALGAAFVTAVLSMIALLAFFAWLNDLVRDAAPTQTALARLSLMAAAASAALVPGSLVILFGAAHAGKDTALLPSVAAFANDAQFSFLAAGVMFGGVALFCAMLALKGTGALPGWLVVSGLVVGVVALAALAFIPVLLFFLWLLVAGITLVTKRTPARANLTDS